MQKPILQLLVPHVSLCKTSQEKCLAVTCIQITKYSMLVHGQTDIQSDKQMHTDTQTDTRIHTCTDRQRERYRNTHTHTHTDASTYPPTHRTTDIHYYTHNTHTYSTPTPNLHTPTPHTHTSTPSHTD